MRQMKSVAKSIDLHMATGRMKRRKPVETVSEPPPAPGPRPGGMRRRPRSEAGRSRFTMRKAIVEPVLSPVCDPAHHRRHSPLPQGARPPVKTP